jgi:SAM-dependent methyltransferase
MPDVLSRNCPVCGHGEATTHLSKNDLHLTRCKQCSMVYVNPVPAQYASGKYYDESAAEYYLSDAKLKSDYADVRFERELRLFRNFCTAGAVLDVGCSSGAFLFQLNQRFPGCYQILGTDASGPALDYAASRGVPVVRSDFPVHDFGGKRSMESRSGPCWSISTSRRLSSKRPGPF